MDIKDIKEKLTKVDKRIWVAIGCGILFLVVFSFITFTNFGRTLLMVLGSILFTVLLVAACYKLYVVILKKLGVENVPADINVKFSAMRVPNASKYEPEVVEFELDDTDDVTPSERVECEEVEAEESDESQNVVVEVEPSEVLVNEENSTDTEVEPNESPDKKA